MWKKVLLLFVTVSLFGAISVAAAQKLVRVDKVSNSGFDKTVSQIETALKAKGMMIVATIDHQNMLRMVGISIKGSKTVEFAKIEMGKMVFTSEPAAGLEMPGRIYIWERADGKTVVSYYKPSVGFAGYGKENLKVVGQTMDKMLEEIVAEGTK